MKKTYQLLLTLTTVVIFSCSNSENEEISENFLQKFDNTVWEFSNSSVKNYYIFKNNNNKPVTTLDDFFSLNSNCYFYGDEFGQLNSATYGNELTLTVQNNEIKIISNYGTNENYIDTFTISGNNIIRKHTENYFGNTSESERILVQSNVTESELQPICK